MFDDTGDLGLADGTNLTVQTLKEIEATCPELPSPSQIPNAVFPVILTGKGRNRGSGVAHEAANRVGVKADEERDEQMVRVPERLERLLSDAMVGGRVHQEHAKKHDMPSHTTGLDVVNLNGRNRTNLGFLDIIEAEMLLVALFVFRLDHIRKKTKKKTHLT